MHRRADHLPPLPHRKEIGARHCCGRPRDKCRLLTQNPGRCHLPPAHNSQLIGQHLAYRNDPIFCTAWVKWHAVQNPALWCTAKGCLPNESIWLRTFRTANLTFPERKHPRGAFGTGKRGFPERKHVPKSSEMQFRVAFLIRKIPAAAVATGMKRVIVKR